MNIEPIIITSDKQYWTHPEIAKIVEFVKDEDQLNEKSQVWTGPFVRIRIEQDNKTLDTVCFFQDKEEYEAHLNHCYKKFNEDVYDKNTAQVYLLGILTSLTVSLSEDVWAPGGKQFCFTEFGKHIGNYFDYSKPINLLFISPDIGIHDEGDHWSWSS